MADLLVDTDIWIDHLRGHRRIERGADRLHLSSITRAELFAGASAEQDGELIRALLSVAQEVPVGAAVAEAAGHIRRRHGLRLADAVIAATAKSVGATLLTRNRVDFAGVPGLRIRTPR